MSALCIAGLVVLVTGLNVAAVLVQRRFERRYPWTQAAEKFRGEGHEGLAVEFDAMARECAELAAKRVA